MIFHRLQIFISSSMEELGPERRAVKAALDNLELDAWVFEYDAGARPQSPQQTYRAALEESDLYIGILGTKLGVYTLDEYNTAIAAGKDTLIYEKNDGEPRSPEIQQFLDDIGDVKSGRTIRRFREAQDLSEYVKQDVAAWQAAKVRERIAAVRVPANPANPDEREWLDALLRKVHQFWIENVLNQSLDHEARIDIPVEAPSSSVEHPWEQILLLPARAPKARHAPVQDLFAESHNFLLILGAPGAGKTITLLELTRFLIHAAEHARSEPVPVVLNLASWTGQSLAAWLESELGLRYQVPKRIARRLVENYRLILLLDGLDEVRAADRRSCASAINHFLEELGAPGMAVCCREEEYAELAPVRLRLGGAVRLQPLQLAKVDEHLARAGPPLAGLRTALQSDPALSELAETPLLLDLMRIAYRDVSAGALATGTPHSLDERRRVLIDAYIQRMFERRGRSGPYSREDSLAWLSKIADKMRLTGESAFQIETLQPTWLGGSLSRWIYVLCTRTLTAAPLGLLWGNIPAALWWSGAGLGVGFLDRWRLSRSRPAPQNWNIVATACALMLTGWVAVAGAVLFFMTPFVSIISSLRYLPLATLAVTDYLFPGLLNYLPSENLFRWIALVWITAVPLLAVLPFAVRASFWNARVDVRRAETTVLRWRRFAVIFGALALVLFLLRPKSAFERGQHVRLLKSTNGSIERILNRRDDAPGLGFSPDGTLFWTSSGDTQIWRTADGSLVHTQPQTNAAPLFDSNGDRYVLSSSKLEIWDRNHSLIGRLDPGKPSWSRDARRVYVERSEDFFVYDAADLRLILSIHTGAAQLGFNVSQDERRLEEYFGDHAWDLETGESITREPTPLGPSVVGLELPYKLPPECGEFFNQSPDNRAIVTVGSDLCLSDRRSGRLLARTPTASGAQGTFSPDSTRVVVEIGRGAARRGALWDTATGAEIASLAAGHNVVFSPDSSKLVTDGEDLRDARDGRVIGQLNPKPSYYQFSPDSAHLLISGKPEEYSSKAQLVLVFGFIIALLVSRRTAAAVASVQGAHGARTLARHALAVGALVGSVVALTAAFTVHSPISLARLALTGFALAAWFFGAMDLFHHYLLRLFMLQEHVLPWRFKRLLDFGVQLALLRRVGDGYIFIHRLLLEHLASTECRN